MNYRELLKDKKRVVIKVGSSSLIHKETNKLDLRKLEVLVRELSDLHNQGKDVVLVTSGAVAVGASAFGMHEKPTELKKKQACSAVGQARLMMIYQKLFSEYNQMAAQILMTKNTMVNNLNRRNARNTFEELLELGAIPVVNENDSISSYELEMLESFGDNDTLSAVIAGLIGADLLILLSDIDGLFTDDPNTNPDAEFIDTVEVLDEKLLSMGKGPKSKVGTGGMATKLTAAEIATAAGADMVIFSGGKTLCGPQDSGVIFGTKQWIERCIRFGAPEHGICRVSKTSREAMAGLYTALENYVLQDEEKRECELREILNRISEKIVKTEQEIMLKIVEQGPVGQKYPRLFCYLSEKNSSEKIVSFLRKERIYIGEDRINNAVYISPLNLHKEEADVVADVLCKALEAE